MLDNDGFELTADGSNEIEEGDVGANQGSFETEQMSPTTLFPSVLGYTPPTGSANMFEELKNDFFEMISVLNVHEKELPGQ